MSLLDREYVKNHPFDQRRKSNRRETRRVARDQDGRRQAE